MFHPSAIKYNKTGHFYCGRDCMKIGHSKFYSGENNPFYGKKHSEETLVKMSGDGHWNYGNRKEVKVRKQYTLTCKHCGKEFTSLRNNKKYCSKECLDKHIYPSKVVVKCGYCGKNVEIIACKAQNNHVFCDESCYALYRKFIYKQPSGPDSHWYGKRGSETPNWQGGLSYEPYSSLFDNALKEQVRVRDNHTCQICGAKQKAQKLSIHHIDYNKKNNDKSNLVSLCRKCHSITNGNRPEWEEFLSKLVCKHEGATTIPKGSTLQANGSGSARHPL